jgi:hypothetical protein
MSEEQTDRLEGGTPFEIRVLRELANLNNGLTSLEEKVDARLRDTRPIWEAVLSRLDSIEARLDRMEAKLNVFSKDLIETRTDVEMLKERPPAA